MNTQETSKSSKTDWILFIITAAITIAMLIWMSNWFWLALPFPLTYLVKAMDII